MDNNCTFATLRLGKTSVADITMINTLSPGVLNPVCAISVVCTQIPQELNEGTYVFIWLGSDNSKGIATEWKQGFKAVGKVTGIQRGEKYNDESTTTVEIGYVFADSVSRLGQYRTNELVRWRMHFLSDAIAEIEGLPEVNRDFCKKQMAEKASPTLPTNCAVLP